MIESRDIAMQSLVDLLHGGPSSDSIPWVEVVAVAQRSGLAPLLFWRLNKQKACEDSVPVVVWEALQRDYHAAVFQGVLREQELIRIIKALDQAGVAALLLKGAALAYSAYPSPWLRLMCDLDLLVDRADLQRVRGVLEALGYMHQPEPQRLNPFNRDFSCETAFLRTVGVDSTLVELHWDLITVEWFRRATALDIEALRARAEPIGVWNVTALSLAPEDQLAHVCLHVSMHGFTYLRGYVDIAQIVKADRIEWDVFLERVRVARIGVACYFPLRWAKHAWHAPVPEEVLRALRPDRLRAWLGGWVIGRGGGARDRWRTRLAALGTVVRRGSSTRHTWYIATVVVPRSGLGAGAVPVAFGLASVAVDDGASVHCGMEELDRSLRALIELEGRGASSSAAVGTVGRGHQNIIFPEVR